MNHEIIFKLNPTVVTIRGDEAYDIDDNLVQYDKVAVQVYVDANAYKSKRVQEYPSIGDQLDDLYHAGVFSEEMAARIEAIKTKYPKG